MRWKIKTVTSVDNTIGVRKTVQTKQLMVSIGDLVGVGKNAVSAVKAAAFTLPAMSRKMPDKGLEPFANSASTLLTVIKGLDTYKKVTSAIEKATPVVQIVARSSGAWCSPGNIGDIAQIVLGQAQKVLISIAIAGILKLKEIIWNYEFPMVEIKTPFVDLINKNIEDLAIRMPTINPKKDNSDAKNKTGDKGSGDGTGGTKPEDNKKPTDPIGIGGSGTIDKSGIDFDNLLEFNDCFKGYITEYKVGEHKRLLRGNARNLGIQYSDDGGETWKETNQKEGSWKKFAKIKNGDKYIYVAGGIEYIKSIESATSVEENTNYFYYDKTIKKYLEYTFNEKKFLLPSKAGVPKEFVKSLGIYYSDNDGIDWKKTNCNSWINDLCEFDSKKAEDNSVINATIVASTNDWKGSYYTEDGINWLPTSVSSGRWLKVGAYEDIYKLIKFEFSEDIALVDRIKVYSAKNVSPEDIYQNFSVDDLVVEKRK